ncbi:hypothetical protein [Jiangella asiatica]|uniref:Copper resistance protein D domain-containing protein n=1 Tax=Jiangella asiatica TaxID=2530372 RepID=A0A4R5CPQ7_9ACTN|nr:hypothetical protein [Jiangella asiatica]TDE02442.1 hypothetical protein E1269_21880 [Jiangella asiatica]
MELADVVTAAVAVAHVGLAAAWLGSMLYGLLIVQPRLARLLSADDELLEELLTRLGAGNRRPVLAIIVGLLVTAPLLAVAVDADGAQVALLAADGALVLAAGGTFARVSWRLWPRRVFALPSERPAHRAALRRHALFMVALVGGAFTAAVTALAIS